MADNDKAISTLNDLIETCKDGAEGFRTAADSVSRPDAKALFSTRVPEIERAASDLQAEVRRLGGTPEDSGSVAASIHRGWINLKAAVTGKDDAAIITEAERGEQLAAKNYEDALKGGTLDAESRTIVDRQYQGTLLNLDKVRALGAAHGASHASVAPTPNADK